MSDDAEQQAEEVEVLNSIYEGDENFKEVNPTTYQYKYIDGEKSFILEILWGSTYPTEKPIFNLEIFYNQNLVPSVKQKILSIVDSEADRWVGCAMTYTLFECLKEKVPEILSKQTEEAIVSSKVEKIIIDDADQVMKDISETKMALNSLLEMAASIGEIKSDIASLKTSVEGFSSTIASLDERLAVVEARLDEAETSKKPEKKDHMTKAQKRRAWDRAEAGRSGEKPRGWDWVDIVKHLSQVPHQPAS